LVLVEGAVARRSMQLLDVDDWAYRLAERTARRDAGRYDVLCFGDSLAKLEIVPRALTERSGLRAYNLAVSGSQAPASSILLRRVLDAGARPTAVLVDFFPPLLRAGPRHNLGRWANLANPAEAARVAWQASDPDLFAIAVLGRFLPSVHRRAAIRAQVTAALSGQEDPRYWWNTLLRRHWSKNAGAHLAATSPVAAGLTDREIDQVLASFYPQWEVHPANRAGVDEFLSLTRSRGIPVFWVLPPVLPALQDRLTSSGFESERDAFIRSFQARYENLTVLDGRGRLAGASAFFDPNHLAAPGAYAFSLALGDALRRSLVAHGQGSARWVAIDRVRPRPLPEGVEDLLASAAALGNVAAVRK
jgi:hypothetical protein